MINHNIGGAGGPLQTIQQPPRLPDLNYGPPAPLVSSNNCPRGPKGSFPAALLFRDRTQDNLPRGTSHPNTVARTWSSEEIFGLEAGSQLRIQQSFSSTEYPLDASNPFLRGGAGGHRRKNQEV